MSQTHHRSWRLHCDGSAHPNPGQMGLGAWVEGPDGEHHTLSLKVAGATGCNNEAELRALLAGLELALRLGVKSLNVYTDSALIASHLRPHAPTPPARLATLLTRAQGLLTQLDQHTLNWMPRHHNLLADQLSRAALGLPPKPAIKPTGRRKTKR